MPGYGYREQGRDVSSSPSRGRKRKSEKGDKKQKKDKKRRKERQVETIDIDAPAQSKKPAEPEQAPGRGRGSWRAELGTAGAVGKADDDDDAVSDGMVAQETEEDVERKLAESRARREALIAKWVNRGEGEGFQNLDTNTSLHDEDPESDGEVAAFFAQQKASLEDKKAEPEDEKVAEEKKAINRFILQSRQEQDGDMFDEDTEAQQVLNKPDTDPSASISQTGASGDDWNDHEGYYKANIGELIGGRYLVTDSNCGKGVFSGVVKAKDQKDGKDGGMVAIKIMRCNDMMRKAAEKEVEVLQRLAAADRKNTRNVIRLLREFVYRDHLCLVFECMWDNLRVALKKYTKDEGMSLKAVRAYTKQLLIALHHIHRCELIHADIKPDNILITAGHNQVKICDLGSAVEFSEIEATPYLVSRFYRSPEICLGAKYGPAADIWAMAATLCELFTGKILFGGKSNNDMIRRFMEVKGKIPHKMIKTGLTWKQHFDENMDFKYSTSDKVTRKKKVQIITDCSAKRSILDIVMTRVGPKKVKSEDREDQLYVRKAKEFADLINQMTSFDAEKRGSAESLLQHPFVAGVGFGAPDKSKK